MSVAVGAGGGAAGGPLQLVAAAATAASSPNASSSVTSTTTSSSSSSSTTASSSSSSVSSDSSESSASCSSSSSSSSSPASPIMTTTTTTTTATTLSSQQQQSIPPVDTSSASSCSSSSLPTSDSCSISTANNTSSTSTPAAAADQRHQHQQPLSGPPHYVDLHVNAGELVSLQLLDGQEQLVAGPATVTMISQQQNPPVPIPVLAPIGHSIIQVVDTYGTLKHIIFSLDSDDGQPRDSSVITLPHGTYRIDSLAQLFRTGPSDDGGISISLPEQQQAFQYANYDGCPVPYDATNSHYQGHQSYNSIAETAVGGHPHLAAPPYSQPHPAPHHHHHSHHHPHHTHSHHAHHTHTDASFKNNHHQVSMISSNFSPAYANTYGSSSVNLASVVSGGMSGVPSGGKWRSSGAENDASSYYQQQRANRGGGDQYNTASAYTTMQANARHGNGGNKRQDPLGGGNLSSNADAQNKHNSNKYQNSRPNVKVMSSNNKAVSPHGGSSVSPIRTRLGKGGGHHQAKGFRNTSHNISVQEQQHPSTIQTRDSQASPIVTSTTTTQGKGYRSQSQVSSRPSLGRLSVQPREESGPTETQRLDSSTDNRNNSSHIGPDSSIKSTSAKSCRCEDEIRERSASSMDRQEVAPPTASTKTLIADTTSVPQPMQSTNSPNDRPQVSISKEPEVNLEEALPPAATLNQQKIQSVNSSPKAKEDAHQQQLRGINETVTANVQVIVESSDKDSDTSAHQRINSDIEAKEQTSSDLQQNEHLELDNSSVHQSVSTPTQEPIITTNESTFLNRVSDSHQQHQTTRDQHQQMDDKTSRRFKCDECGKAFKSKLHLKDHIKVHIVEKPFECLNCNKRFAQLNSYSTHMASKKCILLSLKVRRGTHGPNGSLPSASSSEISVLFQQQQHQPVLKAKQAHKPASTNFNEHHHHVAPIVSGDKRISNSSSHQHNNNNHHHHGNGSKNAVQHPIKLSNLIRQCRNKYVNLLGRLVQNWLSSYSETKFAGLLLLIFTVFAMLLAIFIHLYIVAPVTE